MAHAMTGAMTDAKAPAMADRMSRRHGHSTPLPVVTPSIDLTVGADHVHRFVPAPDGQLYGKTRYRNRCACGQRQHPEPATMDGAPRKLRRLPWGPMCRRCGFPTVAGLVDPDNPLHPCCAEPGLMALGRKAHR